MRLAFVTAALAVAALAGCYGSTEPATDIGPESATLRGHGTADDGPATSWFQYWLTGWQRETRPASPGLSWPAGASGPISQKVTHLTAGASYSFRLCGRDEGEEPVCAQTLTFTTKPAVDDSLFGHLWVGCCSRLDIDARSGPTGANPRGSLSYYASGFPNPSFFNGIVTCLAVNGSRAAVGAVGKWTEQGQPDRPGTWLVTVEDRRTVEDTFHHVETDDSTPPNCAGASWSSQGQMTDGLHEFIVNDAAP